VAVLAGRTLGAQYTALAAADLTIALLGSVTAPVEPGAAATVLYKAEIEAAGKPVEAATAEYAKRYEDEVAGAAALVKAGAADMAVDAAALEILATKRTQRLPKKHGNMAL
jgi:acetyl-CoA carboxylase carboxyltransferase component